MSSATRVLIDRPPFAEASVGAEWHERGFWPAKWVSPPGPVEPPIIVTYRLSLDLASFMQTRVHVTADCRYELFLDGELIGRGPAFSDIDHWNFDSYDLDLAAGSVMITAKVWSFGSLDTYAQMTLRHGFLFAAEGDAESMLSTGHGPWQFKKLAGVTVRNPWPTFGTGGNLEIDGASYPWGIERGLGDGWSDVTTQHAGTIGPLRNNVESAHLLEPATLPAMTHEPVEAGRVRAISPCESADPIESSPLAEGCDDDEELHRWQAMWRDSEPLEVPTHTGRRVLIDLDDYFCAYAELTTRGGDGATISILWAESLWDDADCRKKSNRDLIDGKYFLGVGDVVHPGGNGEPHWFRPVWWQAGRYVLISVVTGNTPLVIERINLFETRYPLKVETEFHCDDKRIEAVIPIAIRGLENCSHETFIDCPYYEQMMYSGDNRLAAFATRALTRDSRLVASGLKHFHYSKMPSGLLQGRYPCRVKLTLPSFCLFWVGGLVDHARWTGDEALTDALRSTARGVLDAMWSLRNDDGLIENLPGWHFMDWVPAWAPDGEPLGWNEGPHAIINLLTVYTLELLGELEDWRGEPDMASLCRRRAEDLRARVVSTFWKPDVSLFADDLQGRWFSEHAQCFAVLSDSVPVESLSKLAAKLGENDRLARTTLAFSHYLFETYRKLDQPQLFFDRLEAWPQLLDLGLKTTPETPEPTRSDCHGWNAHVLHHFQATVLGVRPAAMGFTEVEVRPQLGPLNRASGRVVHPDGWIDVELRRGGEGLSGQVSLPGGVSGRLIDGKREMPLHPGVNAIQA